MADFTVICDIDGTISDDRWRRHYLEAKDYDSYHSNAFQDNPIGDVIDRVIKKTDDFGAGLLFVTGRPKKYRESTLEWLRTHVGHRPHYLFMRPDGDDRPSPALKLALVMNEIPVEQICAVFDDRVDVLSAFERAGVGRGLCWHCELESAPRGRTTAAILESAASTFAERNAMYGDNFRNVAPTIRAMFPDGVPSDLITTDNWHLFELLVVKLTRFANSNLKHQDSIHDAMVYAAMIESNLEDF